jgi:hypothetical protein
MINLNGQLAEQEEFRVVLIFSWSQMVLVELHDEHRQLPRINIPQWIRTPEQIRETLRVKWGVQTIVIDLLPKRRELPPCAVIEVRTRDWEFTRDGLVPVSVDDTDDRELTAPERLTVRSIIAGHTQGRGPFSKLGWIEEAQEWIRESVRTHRVDFNDDIRQFSASGFFALVRFGTFHGPAFWLKATSAPNVHEFTVTQTIARYCPQFLPPLIGARKDWNAWVTEEVGLPLDENICFHAFREATGCLAEIQIICATHVNELLACGCFDQRMPVLQAHLPGLMHYIETAMAKQTSTRVPTLNRGRLGELGSLLLEATSAMEASGLPDTLIHNDVNMGNILFDGTRAVFTDWAEAGIGIPFLTFQHLYIQALNTDETGTWGAQLKTAYKEHWRIALNDSQIERAFALSPPLALASYLCGRDPSFTSPHRDRDSVQSYARSLARHMDRFAREPEFLGALCS